MKKKVYLLCICVCACLCACGGKILGQGLSENMVQISDSHLSEVEKVFLVQYQNIFDAENAKRAALIYLDGDYIPELLILKDGEYRLYSYDGSEGKAISMPGAEVKANAYGLQDAFIESYEESFYWFEYVPHEGLIRVHSGTDGEMDDYYLKYADGFFSIELEVKSIDYTWHTYDAEGEILKDEFLSRLSDLGYDKLIPCGYLYENVGAAYENIDVASDSQNVLEDFVNGNINGVDHVDGISDIPEESFVMRSYEDFFDEMMAGDDAWRDIITIEYVDFDNDDEDEMIIHGFAGSCMFFDVIGDTVYRVLETSSTTDLAYVAEFKGKRVVARTDLTHGGRKSYRILQFDPCCCLIDWFHLYAEYEGTGYTEESLFKYNGDEISMEEFEGIVNSIVEVEG